MATKPNSRKIEGENPKMAENAEEHAILEALDDTVQEANAEVPEDIKNDEFVAQLADNNGMEENENDLSDAEDEPIEDTPEEEDDWDVEHNDPLREDEKANAAISASTAEKLPMKVLAFQTEEMTKHIALVKAVEGVIIKRFIL